VEGLPNDVDITTLNTGQSSRIWSQITGYFSVRDRGKPAGNSFFLRTSKRFENKIKDKKERWLAGEIGASERERELLEKKSDEKRGRGKWKEKEEDAGEDEEQESEKRRRKVGEETLGKRRAVVSLKMSERAREKATCSFPDSFVLSLFSLGLAVCATMVDDGQTALYLDNQLDACCGYEASTAAGQWMGWPYSYPNDCGLRKNNRRPQPVVS
jgi:hypothetical protein